MTKEDDSALKSIEQQKEQFIEFFKVIDGNNSINGYRNFFRKPNVRTYSIETGNILSNTESIINLSNQNDVYFEVCIQRDKPLPGKRGSVEGVLAIPGWWLDVDIQTNAHSNQNLPRDIESAIKFIQSITKAPSLIVHSGNGLHMYWLLKQPLLITSDEERAKAKRLSEQFQSFIIEEAKKINWYIDNTSDLVRLLRIPGTFNRKADPLPVYIYSVTGARYGLDEFEYLPKAKAEVLIKNSLITAAQVPSGTISEGQRNVHLTSIAGKMHQAGLTKDEILAALEKVNTERCQPPLDVKEVENICNSVTNYNQSTSAMFTDIGNAKRFVEKFGSDLKYVHSLDKWFKWNDKQYLMDETGLVMECSKEVIQDMYVEAAKSQANQNYMNALTKHADRSAMNPRLNALVNLSKSDRKIVIKLEDLDRNPWLLNCSNGTLDLKTGQLMEHKKEDFITKMLPVAYDSDAKCNRFLAYLDKIMKQNIEMISYLQRVVGYCLTGATIEQCMFLCHGEGSNGKTTLLEILRELLGDYARNADTDSFTAHFYQTIKNDIARLKDSRFVTAAETDTGMKLSESLIKQIAGGDTITVRFLHKEHFEYKPTFKLFIAANHKPQIKGGDHGIWRKIRLIPFDVKISEDEKDKTLLEKLKKELPGILAWAVQGCLEWQKVGLNDPALVTDATEQYQSDMDELNDYFEDCCIIGDNESVKVKDIFNNYRDWCSRNSYSIMKKVEFKLKVEARGYKRQKAKDGWYWTGISIKNIAADTNVLMDENSLI